jgi:hypothetical protein
VIGKRISNISRRQIFTEIKEYIVTKWGPWAALDRG